MFSAYLWGIETTKAAIVIFATAPFSAYLWGIETVLGGEIMAGKIKFSAYLWGIETSVLESVSHCEGRFQPTYEELKLNPSNASMSP